MGMPAIFKNRHVWVIPLLIFYAALFLQYDYRAPKRNFSDFHMMYMTGDRFLKGEPIYTYEGGVSYFKYPPFYAFFMGPLSILSERNAARLWHLLNLLFLSVLFMTMARLLPEMLPTQRPLLYLFSGIASFRIVLENLHEGQANLFMLTLLWSAIYCFAKGRNLQGGFLFAFSMATKYLTVLFIPVLLLQRKFRALLWTLVFLIVLTLLPALAVGLEKNFELLQEGRIFLFKSSLDDISITTPPNQSLLAFLCRLFYGESPYGFHLLGLGRGEIFALYLTFCAVFYLLCLVSLPRTSEADDRLGHLAVYGLVCLCMSLFNPNAWRNAFLPICVAYLVIFGYLLVGRWRDRVAAVLAFLSFCLISLSSEFFVQEKGVKLTDLYSTVTLGTMCLFGALLKVRISARRMLRAETGKR